MKRISGGQLSRKAKATLLSSHAEGPRTAAGDTSFTGQAKAVDTAVESQPAASPRTYRSGRTSPPRQPHDFDSDSSRSECVRADGTSPPSGAGCLGRSRTRASRTVSRSVLVLANSRCVAVRGSTPAFMRPRVSQRAVRIAPASANVQRTGLLRRMEAQAVKQSVDVSFAKGLDTKTDPWRVQIGNFLALKI